ncbi:MAG: shikimate dehydrogenase [Phycisphaerae bacterium]|jgi:3-dehydroquinate dehydratase/shikimate dehydrogenase
MASDRGHTRLICSLTSPDAVSMRADMVAAAAAGADTVECRLDLLQPAPNERTLRSLLADPPLEVIATCRPVRQGGHFAGEESWRLEILRLAVQAGATFVDVEDDVDPAAWPAGRVICSFHEMDGCPPDLEKIVRRLDDSPAEVSKVAFTASSSQDALRALDVLHNARKPTLALAMGEAGAVSRILARKFSAFGTFASLRRGAESAAGQLTIQEMRQLYRWDGHSHTTSIYGVVGYPLAHTMSPAIHNAAFAAEDLDAVYVPLLVQPGEDNFRRFMDALADRPWLHWRGLSITIPHKANALAYVGPKSCAKLARQIGAVNTILFGSRKRLRGENTDCVAALDALCEAMGIRRAELAGKTVAVLGAGGAARAVVAGLREYRSEVTVYNRTLDRAEELAKTFSCRAAGLDEVAGMSAEILINCTSVGMHPHVDSCPLAAIPPSVKVVFDTIYNPVRTRLLQRAGEKNCLTVSGVEMFINQAMVQFKLWTGREAPADVMRRVVLEKLDAGGA